MSFPVRLAEAIDALDAPLLERGVFARGVECQGSKFHSPNPLVIQEFTLRDGSTAMLCCTCESNLQVLLAITDSTDGPVAWSVRRDFGNLIRALAERSVDA